MKLYINGVDSQRLPSWAVRTCARAGRPVYQVCWTRVENRMSETINFIVVGDLIHKSGINGFARFRHTLLPGNLRS